MSSWGDWATERVFQSPSGLQFPVEMGRVGVDSQELLEPKFCPSDLRPRPLLHSGSSCFPPPGETEGGRGVRSADPLPHQDLIFDLGDPVRWEYLLLGTDKPQLSIAEEDDDGLNDDDDMENLVSLICL